MAEAFFVDKARAHVQLRSLFGEVVGTLQQHGPTV